MNKVVKGKSLVGNRVFIVVIGLWLSFAAAAQASIDNHGSWARIVASGKPMLMIGGELGNSSASTPADIRRCFSHVNSLGLNTVLVPVSWELIEPAEGRFDFSTLDAILSEARSNDLKVVLLWFGAWKNAQSCYAPAWFKTDTKRFPRVHTYSGKQLEQASPLSEAVLEADTRAFCSMLRYLRDHDRDQTVVMVQVENEIGIFDTPRDCSADATTLWQGEVPRELIDYLSANRDNLHPYMASRLPAELSAGTWGDVFGHDMYGQEICQAWAYAKYVGRLAAAGKAVYPLPMYVNVALDSRGRTPGQYSSGGPLAQLIDIWRCGAPDIDVYGVDIYDKGFADWCERYHLPGNPLFIPEIRLEDRAAMYALYAFGHHDAMGFCPFSIEDYPLTADGASVDWRTVDVTADDQLNTYSVHAQSLSPIAAVYRLLRQAEPLILERQGTDDMEAVLLDDAVRSQQIFTPDSVCITVRHSMSLGWDPISTEGRWPEAACMILRLAPMDYLVIGSNVVLTFTPAGASEIWHPGDQRMGILSCEEVEIVDGQPRAIRRLNGDQTHQGRHVRIPYAQHAIQRFTLYPY